MISNSAELNEVPHSMSSRLGLHWLSYTGGQAYIGYSKIETSIPIPFLSKEYIKLKLH